MKKIQCQLIHWVSSPPASRPMRAAARDREGEDAHRLGALVRLGEAGDDEGDDNASGKGGADALEEAGHHQQGRVGGEPAQHRGGGEEDDPAQEDLLAADQVARPPRQQHEAAVGDEVGVDDPGQVGLAEVQVPLDRRQGDVHDRRVEHDHQLAEADDDEGDPAPPIATPPWDGQVIRDHVPPPMTSGVMMITIP